MDTTSDYLTARLSRNEKLLLLELILVDLHGAWGCEAEERIQIALRLARELDLDAHVQRLSNNECDDANYFQLSHRLGGYEGMDQLHGLDYSPLNKSPTFLMAAGQILQHPERVLHRVGASSVQRPVKWECATDGD